ncbi:MAG: signal recognition particle-docking protein FtsY [Planctomycetota bacterium]|nr:signal recognition particle-docking protein FtsY [Planctomycetota bacterium]
MAWNLFGKKEKNDPADAGPSTQKVDSQLEPSPPKSGIFGRLKQALVKTYHVLNTDIKDVFKEGRLVDDAFLKEVFAILIKTDMGASPAAAIRDAIGKKYRARKVEMNDFIDTAKETIREIMDQPEQPIKHAQSGPTVIMVCGVNGAGKTTSIAKLAYLFTQQGKKVVLGAGDTFRAAAVEQLTVWANRLDAQIVTGKPGGDPASVSYQAVAKAKELEADICIIDTAGRLQTQTPLMDQLTKIRNVMQKVIAEAPHECLLVLDATAGQNAISQAKGFSEAAGCTGIVLAKLDGTAKGGVAIPIRQEFNLPVKYIGLGEKADDFALFNVESFVEALFDSEQ